MNKRLIGLGIGWLAIVFTALAQTNPLDRKVSISRSAATIQEVLTELSDKYQSLATTWCPCSSK